MRLQRRTLAGAESKLVKLEGDLLFRSHVLTALFYGLSDAQAVMIEALTQVKTVGLVHGRELFLRLNREGDEFHNPDLQKIEAVGQFFLLGSALENNQRLYFRVGRLMLHILANPIDSDIFAGLGAQVTSICGSERAGRTYKKTLARLESRR